MTGQVQSALGYTCLYNHTVAVEFCGFNSLLVSLRMHAKSFVSAGIWRFEPPLHSLLLEIDYYINHNFQYKASDYLQQILLHTQ